MPLKIKFAPDVPADLFTYDPLQFRAFTESLQQAIYRTRPPFAYGVLGDWGSGKTSILNFLQHLLEDDLQSGQALFVPIRFEAWKYENEENLIFPLLHTIRADDERRVPGPNQAFLERFKGVALTGTLVLTDVALRAATKTLTGGAISVGDIAGQFERIRARASALEDVLSGWANQVDSLHDAFAGLLDCYAADLVRARGRGEDAAEVRFVILVDDLDRCLPQTVIKILESIKNYLLTRQCIFVLALNPRVVYEGIRMKYAGLSVDGREYLEKIVNYSFYVPEPLPEQSEAFARKALEKLVEPEDAQRLAQYFDYFSQAVRDCNFTNPRKVKRILNHYLFFLSLHEKELDQYQMPYIARLIVLAEYFPALFQVFIQNGDDAQNALRNIFTKGGTNSVISDTTQFEKKFGFDLKPIFQQLSYMNRLFDQFNSDRDLTKHVRAVYQIVHHPI